jgi:hypothetical protein
MFEYHGWVSVSDSPGESDTSKLNFLIEDIKSFIGSIKDREGFIELHVANGACHIAVSGMLNRFSDEVKNIFDLYKFISRKACGSYGVLYTRDSDDDLRENEFVVFVLAKGRLTEKKDVLLSPCNPVIED